MDLTEAQNMAEELIAKYCPNFKFKFGRMKTQLGTCNHSTKTIKLSQYFVKELDEDRVRNTILHEIAHALTQGHNHDRVWQNKAIALGCSGERTACLEPPKTKGRMVYKCPICQTKSYAYRKLKRKRACKHCCKRFNNGKYTDEFAFVYVGRE